MQPEQIAKLIETGIAGATAIVEGDDGTHFSAVVVSDAFAGKSLVQQHQIVYRALGERMGREIHALSMQTFTPEEWRRRRPEGG